MQFALIVFLVVVCADRVEQKAVLHKKTVKKFKPGQIKGQDVFVPQSRQGEEKEFEAEEHTQEKNEKARNNVEIAEGDVAVNDKFRAIRSGKKVASRRDFLKEELGFLWTDGYVPYMFSSLASTKMKEVVKAAIEDFNNYTCIRIVPRTNEKDYILFDKRQGCYSYIGRAGGGQPISLGDGCLWKGTVIHELMHALGFFHEHTRLDRDDYVKIHFDNIIEKYLNNFKKYLPEWASMLDEPYDYQSVMQYFPWAFAKDKSKMTIEPLDSNVDPEDLGQRRGFSEIDIKQINKGYKCNRSPTQFPTATGITTPGPSNKKGATTPQTTIVTTTKPKPTTKTPKTTTTLVTTARPDVMLTTEPPLITIGIGIPTGSPTTDTPETTEEMSTTTPSLVTTPTPTLPPKSTNSPLTPPPPPPPPQPAKSTPQPPTLSTGALDTAPPPLSSGAPGNKSSASTCTDGDSGCNPTKIVCQQDYPCWPIDFSWSASVEPLQQSCCQSNNNNAPASQAPSCSCQCTQLNDDILKQQLLSLQVHPFICHKRTVKDPNFVLSKKDLTPDMDCLRVPTNETAAKQDNKDEFLCYSKAANYNLHWTGDKLEKKPGTLCLPMTASKNNQTSRGDAKVGFLCGGQFTNKSLAVKSL